MQIEKLNNNKLKVILNINDLEKNNIDLNNFMANSLESQELFLDILDLAEEKYNFYVNGSKLIIESVSLANNIFIFTITKLNECNENNISNYIYCFNSFNDIANIFYLINKKNLYKYNNKYYLICSNNDKVNNIIEEFSTEKINSPYLKNILIEHGKRE